MFIFVFPRCLSHYVHVLLTFYWTLEGPVLWADNLLKGLPLGTATHCYTGHCSWYHWWHPLLTRKTSLVKCHENVRLRCDRLKYSDGCFRCCILSDSIDRLLLLHPRINHWLWRQPFLKFLESLARKLLEDRWVIPASASRSRQVEHTQIRLGQGKWRWSLIMILYDYQWSWALMMIDDHDLWWWSVIMILDDDQWLWSLLTINDHDTDDPGWWPIIINSLKLLRIIENQNRDRFWAWNFDPNAMGGVLDHNFTYKCIINQLSGSTLVLTYSHLLGWPISLAGMTHPLARWDDPPFSWKTSNSASTL